MKRSRLLLVILSISILSMLPKEWEALASVDEMVLEQKFDDEATGSVPVGWTVFYPQFGNFTVDDSVYYGGSGKSGKFVDSGSVSGGYPFPLRTFPEQTGTITLELVMYPTGTEFPNHLFAFCIDNGGDEPFNHTSGANIYFKGGYIQYYNGIWHSLQPFSANMWYKIRMDIDIPSNTYNIYIDDILEAEDVPFFSPTGEPATNLTRLHFASVSTATPIGYVDNIRIKCIHYLTLTTDPSGVTTPYGEGWYDAGAYAPISTDEYVDIMPASSRYKFINWTTEDISEISDPASTSTTVLMDKTKTVTANYSVQYLITFDQSGANVDYSGTLVTIDGLGYGVGDLPVSFWWNEASTHSFSFQSPLVVTSDAKRYVWDSTTGLSAIQSDSLTITTAGEVTGNYKTQYYLKVISPYATPGGEGWYDSDVIAYATLDTDTLNHGNGTRRLFTSWSGDTSGADYAQSDPILINAPKTAFAGWKTQHYLTVKTDPSGITAISGEAWYDESTNVSLTAPSVEGYIFLYWDLDGVSQGSSVIEISLLMDSPHTATAHYMQEQAVVGGLTVSINSPLHSTCISPNILLIAVIFTATFWMKRSQRKTSSHISC